ncbi:ATP-binding cassette sub-family C member 10-like [Halichondria panicea]|uniref:ATP-binding cassette sub-family C member 10-like n=1 Tax=Halichondria panicea TaxID=6063 RepID=UPI00312B68D6
MEGYLDLCYSPILGPSLHSSLPTNSTFTPWTNGDFDICFESLLTTGCAVLLALTSALYAGCSHTNLRRRKKPLVLSLRALLCVCIIATFLVELVASFWLARERPYSVLLMEAAVLVCWSVHLLMLWIMSRSISLAGRGPLTLHCAWFTTLLMAVFKLHTVIAWRMDSSPYQRYHLPIDEAYFTLLQQITTCVYFALQILYLLTLPFKIALVTGHNVQLDPTRKYLTTQVDDDESSRQHLISSQLPRTDYGTIATSPPSLKDTSEDGANVLSLLTFWWVQPLMKKGWLGGLQTPQDLPSLPSSLSTHNVKEQFRNTVLNRGASDSKWTLVKDLNRSFGLHYYPLGLLKFLADLLGFAGPLLLHQLVAFIENRQEPLYHGYLYALGLFLSTLLGAFLLTHFNYQVNKVGVKVRSALITEIYRKALSVTTTTLSHFSTGQVVNSMSTDTDRIVNFCSSFHQFWSLPFQVIISLGLLYQQVGLAFLAGLVFCVLLIPVNRWLAVKIGKLSTSMMEQKDARVKVMSEVLTGIRVIKFYCWERYFLERILGIRSLELKALKGRKYLDALCVYFWATTPVLISILTFATYVAMGNTLTAAKVFTSIALFSILISPLNAFPWVINGLVEAWVSVKRVQVFLRLEELGQYYTTLQDKQGFHGDDQSIPAVTINHGCFTWTTPTTTETTPTTTEGERVTLTDINLTIHPGELVGVVGRVGSGKSSLLSAITAEMNKLGGEVGVACVGSGFGLATQECWIQHATVRDNILFGLPYQADRYNRVLHACALHQDLLVLPGGDLTEVGENGVTLSGGQKARISLARAVYQDKSVYLLDDPLSAVDAHVGAHLFTHCIMGLLARKTRILATHHIRFLSEAHTVVAMENGRIVSYGPPSVVLPSLVAREITSQPEPEEDSCSDADTAEPSPSDVLVKEEEKEVGVVKLSVYRAYWTSVGHPLAIIIMTSFLLMQASRNVSDWWLSYWIAHSYNDSYASANITASVYIPHHSTLSSNTSIPILSLEGASDNLAFYLGIYGGLAVANTVFTLLRAFLYAYGGVRAATVLHKRLLRAILRAPVAFFDVTPIGRIINRFSSDLYAIDDSLPFILNILLAQFFAILGTLAVTCYGLPWFALLLLPLGLLYYHIQKYYRRTSRELKRLSTVTLSPVYAHFSESLSGLTTIRALRASGRFAEENTTRLDLNQRANYSSFAVAQWLGIRLQMLGVAMVTGVALIAVLEHHFNSVDPGLVGLAISYALSVTNLLSGVVTSFTETEKEMVSVERAEQYIGGVVNEGQRSSARTVAPPVGWPTRGVVEFKGVHLVYREGLPPALKDLSFITRPMEKLGVVGRTGAGKSSLFQALFRLTELTRGTILIDSVDTAVLSLENLRGVLAVIPQDPFLFSGTVRDNLDPGSHHSDTELWSVLERCHLKDPVLQLGGLGAEVQERGRVFSVGERQLLCLARALLTSARVVCVDEATASVDMDTDSRIQETIRNEFTHSTVITIAHRIETVLGCDRILVMEAGGLRELDTPTQLLDNNQSLFYKLYKEHTS